MRPQRRAWTAAIFFAAFMALVPSASEATVYLWVDDEGVKHFSNIPPPEGAEIVFRQEEIAYDQEADIERRSKDDLARQTKQLEEARQRLAAAEAALDETIQRARDAEQRAAELAAAVATESEKPESYRYGVIYPYGFYRPTIHRYNRRWHHPGQRPPRPKPDKRWQTPAATPHAHPPGGKAHPGSQGTPGSRPAAWGDSVGGLKLYIRF